MNLENQILDFKSEVINNGMCMTTYLNKRKDFINRIDDSSKKSMEFFKYLYYLDLISQQQYLNMREKVDNSKKYYKSLLSFY